METLKVGTLDDIQADMEHGTYNMTRDGKCSQCGACCSNYLALSNMEILRIREYVKKHKVKEQKHEMNFLAAKPMLDLTCPFLNTDKDKEKCEIYAVRPDNCKYFICDPEKRDVLKLQFERCDLSKKRPVDMRETFFGKYDFG